MKPLLIGEAPSKNEVTETPLEGRIGKRLAAWSGLSYDEYLAHFARVNLLHVRQDTKENGFTFDMAAAQAEARRLRQTFQPGQRVILLGNRVGDAFGFVNPCYECLVLHDLVYLYKMPHPSGVNRVWNDRKHVRNVELFMRGIVRLTRV